MPECGKIISAENLFLGRYMTVEGLSPKYALDPTNIFFVNRLSTRSLRKVDIVRVIEQTLYSLFLSHELIDQVKNHLQEANVALVDIFNPLTLKWGIGTLKQEGSIWKPIFNFLSLNQIESLDEAEINMLLAGYRPDQPIPFHLIGEELPKRVVKLRTAVNQMEYIELPPSVKNQLMANPNDASTFITIRNLLFELVEKEAAIRDIENIMMVIKDILRRNRAKNEHLFTGGVQIVDRVRVKDETVFWTLR
jgi:hypothetical protein